METNESIDTPAQHSPFLGADDARMVVDFAVIHGVSGLTQPSCLRLVMRHS